MHTSKRALTHKPRTHTQLCGCSRRSLTGVRRLWHSTTTSARSLSLAPMARCEHCGSDPAAPRGPPRSARKSWHRSVSAQRSRVPARLLWRADVVVSPGADLAGLPHVTTATSAPGLGLPLSHLHRDWGYPCHISSGTGLQIAILVVDDSNTPGLKGYTLRVRTCITVPDSRCSLPPGRAQAQRTRRVLP